MEEKGGQRTVTTCNIFDTPDAFDDFLTPKPEIASTTTNGGYHNHNGIHTINNNTRASSSIDLINRPNSQPMPQNRDNIKITQPLRAVTSDLFADVTDSPFENIGGDSSSLDPAPFASPFRKIKFNLNSLTTLPFLYLYE